MRRGCPVGNLVRVAPRRTDDGILAMLVCSCNRLSDRALAAAARRLAADPARRIVTPGAVFRECGARPRCGGCFPLVIEVTHKALGEDQEMVEAHGCACAGCACEASAAA